MQIYESLATFEGQLVLGLEHKIMIMSFKIDSQPLEGQSEGKGDPGEPPDLIYWR